MGYLSYVYLKQHNCVIPMITIHPDRFVFEVEDAHPEEGLQALLHNILLTAEALLGQEHSESEHRLAAAELLAFARGILLCRPTYLPA